MTRPKLRSLVLAAVLALVAVTTGCGDDKPSPEDDRASAGKVSLKAADLPSGWSSAEHEKLPGEDELATSIDTCVGISPRPARATAVVKSEDFKQGLATINSVVTYVESESEAKADAAALTGDKFAECARPGYEQQVQAVAPEGNTIVDVKIEKLDLPTFGEASAANRITVTINVPGPGITLPINIDLIRVFKERTEIDLTIVAPGETFPAEMATGMAQAMVSRV